jgi:hypothetical protein
MLDSILSYGPMAIIGALFSSPLTSLVLAIAAVLAIIVFNRDRGSAPAAPPEYRAEQRMLGIAALGVIVVFTVEHVLRNYVVMPVTVSWWRVAVAPALATVGIAVVLTVIVVRRHPASASPVPPLARRTWLTFAPSHLAICAAVAASVLAATTIAAGLLSSANRVGQYVYLDIPIPNAPDVDPIRTLFYGWTYGTVALVALVALFVVTMLLLRRSAAQPYARIETVEAEKHARRATATASLRIALAGILLALAGAWRMIATAGAGSSTLTVLGDTDTTGTFDAPWKYAEFAGAMGWCAPFLEISAFCLLMLVALRAFRRRTVEADAADHAAQAEVGASL